MNATILSAAPLPLPSASAIEIVGETVYVIGDDAPYLYTFRATDLTPGQPMQLFETAHFSGGRLPKELKPDLEAMAFLPGETTVPAGLLVVGSGATSVRETGFWIPLADAEGSSVTVYPVSLTALYQTLRHHLPAGQPLNVEALATTRRHLWIFHRPVGTTAGRVCFRLDLDNARASFRQPAVPPRFRVHSYTVPDLNGQPGGLSGATFFDDRLFVTASVEVTDDPVRDGEVLGSFVGILNPRRPADGQFVPLAWSDGRPFREKVEGIAVRRQLTTHAYELVLVTDDDKGGSTALVVRLDLGT